ncbi:MAG TPA: DNA/RNA nuclease SfsA [Anaerovoracaceae bacterium]|nr:DNA/RNA nuclease SfsA [Anaerovoracaceae bacterium]
MLYKNIVIGYFISRENRFLANVSINGKVENAHVKNTGRLKELLLPNAKVYIEDHRGCDNKRKTRYSIIAVEKDGILFNIDSFAPNKIIEEAILDNKIITDLKYLKREQTYGNSRFDLYYETTKDKGYIEVKGATLEKSNCISFPDAKTTRGLKHVNELIKVKESGYNAMVIFVIQLKSDKPFIPNYEKDKNFCNELSIAIKKGVIVKAFYCNVTPYSITLSNEAKVLIN